MQIREVEHETDSGSQGQYQKNHWGKRCGQELTLPKKAYCCRLDREYPEARELDTAIFFLIGIIIDRGLHSLVSSLSWVLYSSMVWYQLSFMPTSNTILSS